MIKRKKGDLGEGVELLGDRINQKELSENIVPFLKIVGKKLV